MTDLDELRVALKSGEYDGTHIMRAWLLVDKVKELEEELKDADGAAQILANQKVELTAKLDKAKEALSMASWNNIGGYEGQQKWMELNRELDK